MEWSLENESNAICRFKSTPPTGTRFCPHSPTSSLPSFLLSLSLFLSTSFPSAVFLDLFTLDARSTAHFDRSFLPLLPLVPLRISGTCRHIWCRSSRSESYLSPSSGSTTDPLSRWWILFPSIIALAVRFTTQARLRLSLRAHGSPSR